MICNITIVRYPKWLSWAGFLSMAIFHLPLWLNKNIHFYKLMGCGKNGTFDIKPDLQQWALLTVLPNEPRFAQEKISSTFIQAWWKFFRCEQYTLILEPIEAHGSWDGKACFGILPKQTDYQGVIAVLTRATIRFNRLSHFWKHVASVANKMNSANGFISSVGIGEIPWIKQATLSFWENKETMKAFAYQMKEHTEVIRKTKQEKWYSEEMFVRFKPITTYGYLNGNNPLEGKC